MARPQNAQPGLLGSLSSLMATVSGLVSELPELISDRVELLSLELHRAQVALLHIALHTLVLTVLGLSGWLLLWGLALLLLVALGLHWVWAVMVALAVHVLLVWWVVARIQRLLPTLGLPATRRQLMFRPASPPASAPTHENTPTDGHAAP